MKKFTFNIVFSLFFACSLYACSSSNSALSMSAGAEEKTTPSGLKYKVYEEGSGVKPQVGDIVLVHYVGKLENDSVFDSSRKRGEPLRFKLGAGQVIKGWDEGLSYLQVGDKAIFTIPPELAYGSRELPNIPANSTLTFDIELVDVIEGVRPFDLEGKDTISYTSGLKKIKVNSKPNAQKPVADQTVEVHYTGYLPDGKIFDSSVERGKPISFPLGAGRVIKGWDEGIGTMRVGEKARLIIPPDLGYGQKGYPPVIPENATLYFDVELISVSD